MKHIKESASARLELADAVKGKQKEDIQNALQSVSDKYGIKQGEFYPMEFQDSIVVLGVPQGNISASAGKYVIYKMVMKNSVRWGEVMPHLTTFIVKTANYGDKMTVQVGPEWAKKNVSPEAWDKFTNCKLKKIPFKADENTKPYLNNLDKGF